LARLPTNLVVKTHRPGRYRLLVVGLLLALLASSYGLFEFGRIRGGYDFLESREQISQRDREIAQLNRKIEQLRDQVVLLETSSGIDEEAHQQIEQRLQVLQGTIQNQAEGLAFYKGIISPEDGEAGLKIRNFTVEPGTEPGWYLVKIVLIQAKDHGRQVSGVVDLSIDGQLAGEAKTLALADLRQTAGVTGGPAFSFRKKLILRCDPRGVPQGLFGNHSIGSCRQTVVTSSRSVRRRHVRFETKKSRDPDPGRC
jgi:cell division protein FtsB